MAGPAGVALRGDGVRLRVARSRADRDPGGDAATRAQEAVLLLRLERQEEAEAVARPLVEDDEESWTAIAVVARSLPARGRTAEAEAFLAGHDMDADELDDYFPG